MFKKLLKISLLIGMIGICCTGCFYSKGEVNVNPDGSGTTSMHFGVTKDLAGKLGNNFMTEAFQTNNLETFTSEFGDVYIGTTMEDGFSNSKSQMSFGGMGTMSSYCGPITIDVLDNGVRLNVKVFDAWRNGEAEAAAEKLDPSEFNNVEKLKNLSFGSFIYSNIPKTYLKTTFTMPYPVEKVSSEGNYGDSINVNGNKITIDFLGLIKNTNCSEITFDCINSNYNSQIFKDVNPNNWYFSAVNYAKNRGVINGSTDGYFYPHNKVTYGELAKIAFELSDAGEESLVKNKGEYWAIPYVRLLNTVNVLGYKIPETKEGANNYITKEEATYLLLSCIDLAHLGISETDKVNDLSECNPNFYKTLNFAAKCGLIHGDGDGNFYPKNQLTRAELCQLIKNILSAEPVM